jgi:MFS transporter, DHA1 family, multidrug resistance protein
VRVRVCSVLSLSVFTAMLGLGIIIPIMPLYARGESIGASGFWLGAIFAGFSIARSASMPLVGRQSDRTGIRKGFIATGLLLYACSSLGYVYAFDVWSLLAVRVAQGICSAMIVPIAMAYVGEICPVNREGRYMGMFTVALLLGFSVGPLLGGCINDLWSVDAAFLSMGALCLAAFIFVVLLLPPTGSGRVAGAGPSSYGRILRNRQIRGIVLYRFVNAFARASVLVFLPLYASYRLGLSATRIGLVISAGVGLTALLQYPFGMLADRLNRRWQVILGSGAYACAIVLFPRMETFAGLLLLNLLLGVLAAVPLPAVTALAVAEGKHYGMGSTMAVFNVAMSLGLGCGPLVSGLIYDAAGLEQVFYWIAGIGFAGSLLAGHCLSAAPLPEAAEVPRIVEDI